MQKVASTIDRSAVFVLAGVTKVNAITLDVLVSASATPVTDWMDWNSPGTRAPLYVGTTRGDRVRVVVSGVQFASGSRRYLSVTGKAAHRWAPGSNGAFPIRALAADLLAAADEMDALNGVAR
jgi:hypothetical protein